MTCFQVGFGSFCFPQTKELAALPEFLGLSHFVGLDHFSKQTDWWFGCCRSTGSMIIEPLQALSDANLDGRRNVPLTVRWPILVGLMVWGAGIPGTCRVQIGDASQTNPRQVKSAAGFGRSERAHRCRDTSGCRGAETGSASHRGTWWFSFGAPKPAVALQNSAGRG